MSDYNGWTNRETWLVNVWGNPESKADVEAIKAQLEEEIEALPSSGLLCDLLECNSIMDSINWDELMEHFEDEEEEEED